MECTSPATHNVDQAIIFNLQSSPINRRKGEEQLFVNFSYLIAVGSNKYSISEADSFDAYSDTILATIASITNGTFRGKSSLKTYLHGIFYNKCIDAIRKKSSIKNGIHSTIVLNDIHLHLSDNSVSIVEKLFIKSDVDNLRKKLSKLSDTSQHVLLLSADGYTDREIAAKLNFKTASVVKTTRLRCIKKLRQLFTQKEISNSY